MSNNYIYKGLDQVFNTLMLMQQEPAGALYTLGNVDKIRGVNGFSPKAKYVYAGRRPSEKELNNPFLVRDYGSPKIIEANRAYLASIEFAFEDDLNILGGSIESACVRVLDEGPEKLDDWAIIKFADGTWIDALFTKNKGSEIELIYHLGRDVPISLRAPVKQEFEYKVNPISIIRHAMAGEKFDDTIELIDSHFTDKKTLLAGDGSNLFFNLKVNHILADPEARGPDTGAVKARIAFGPVKKETLKTTYFGLNDAILKIDMIEDRVRQLYDSGFLEKINQANKSRAS